MVTEPTEQLVREELIYNYLKAALDVTSVTSTESNNLFRMTGALIMNKTVLPSIHGINWIAYSMAVKAEAFADFMEEQIHNNEISDSDENWDNKI